MEPITLFGAVIVIFGLWVEFEPKLMAVVSTICSSTLYKAMISPSTPRRTVYVRRMPICLAKTSLY